MSVIRRLPRNNGTGEALIGTAPEVPEEIRLTHEQLCENDWQWFPDTETGGLKPEMNPGEGPRTRPGPIRVARRIFG